MNLIDSKYGQQDKNIIFHNYGNGTKYAPL